MYINNVLFVTQEKNDKFTTQALVSEKKYHIYLYISHKRYIGIFFLRRVPVVYDHLSFNFTDFIFIRVG